ncbi:hypothetical protein DRI50_04595 [candidate division KSB1 bacterium]|nr:MAG: hypothetical protein DRI50_04595 [candidate division KSB1 bacterium]
MVRALFFKEWLKIRWAYWTMALLMLLALIKIGLNLSYYIRILEAKNFWYQVIILGGVFFQDFVYLPALIGLVVGFNQFMPEINADRLKLTLHLPMKENAILLYMVGYGTLMLFLLYLGTYILASGLIAFFFPYEVVKAAWVTMAPWFLAGFVVYWVTSAVFVERIWLKRIIIIIIAVLFTGNLLYHYAFEIYRYSIGYFFILALLWSISILYTGYRFKKGVLK